MNEYIKKEDLLNSVTIQDSPYGDFEEKVVTIEDIEKLPVYSFPESKIDKKLIDEAVQKAVEELKQNNIWIPEGMTNGEVIQALFPYVKIEDTSFRTVIGTNLDKGVVPVKMDWWNAPYKAESENKE